jgi:hypothetical protein
MHTSYFEDDFGNVSSKEVSWPKLPHLLYDYLPLIDEHNKQRQRFWVGAQVANKELLVCQQLVKRNVRQNKQLASLAGTDLGNTCTLERIMTRMEMSGSR